MTDVFVHGYVSTNENGDFCYVLLTADNKEEVFVLNEIIRIDAAAGTTTVYYYNGDVVSIQCVDEASQEFENAWFNRRF